jgi:hypothetical protein
MFFFVILFCIFSLYVLMMAILPSHSTIGSLSLGSTSPHCVLLTIASFFVLLHILHCMHVLHCTFCFSHLLFFFVPCFFSSSMFLKLFPFLLKIMSMFMCACLFELFFLCFAIVSLHAFAFCVPTLALFFSPQHLSFFAHLLCPTMLRSRQVNMNREHESMSKNGYFWNILMTWTKYY